MDSLLWALFSGWLVSALFAAKIAGATSKPMMPWHPGRFLCEPIALNNSYSKFVIALILYGTVIFYSYKHPSRQINALVLFLTAPLPLILIDYVRRDTALKSRQYVYFNPFTPVSSRFEKTLEDGKMIERAPIVYLYITSEDWKSITTISTNDIKFFERYKIKGTGALYKATADNEFLHLYDSHHMGKFVVHPENLKAMAAFEEGLKIKAGIKVETATTQTSAPVKTEVKASGTTDIEDSKDSKPIDDDDEPPMSFGDMENASIIDPQTLLTGRSADAPFKPKRRIKPANSKAPQAEVPTTTTPPPDFDAED